MFRPDPHTLYLGDNGRCYCGAHLGATATATGCDLSGLALLALTPEIVRAYPEAEVFRCEQPGCDRRPLHIYTT